MAQFTSREIRLKKRPVGMPSEDDFELVEAKIPEPGKGEVLIRNIYMSVDPYMRGRMNEGKSYFPAFELYKPLEGGCVGQVVISRNDNFQRGDYALGMKGWREYYISDGSGLTKIDPAVAPVHTYLGPLSMTGLTAYVGFLDIGMPREGDIVFVSAASGAVGSIVSQIAKIKGCRVVGSAGSDEKISWLLKTAGIDAAVNYKKVGDLTAELAGLCPEGIDIYFENVGGKHLEAALDNMRSLGRIVLCGMISMYNATQREPGPSNLFLAVTRSLTLRGFLVLDHMDKLARFSSDMGRWIREGRIKWKETVVEGIESAPKAFIGLFEGENFGKMLVKVGPDPGR
ncbi:putative NADP-dependent oxidoreductase YfmJ [Syntrophobacter sp. SbD2]|nr:putative NADP-dependent oxidoreductase YfmJ [Syntrophobacter sp. SbD2]